MVREKDYRREKQQKAKNNGQKQKTTAIGDKHKRCIVDTGFEADSSRSAFCTRVLRDNKFEPTSSSTAFEEHAQLSPTNHAASKSSIGDSLSIVYAWKFRPSCLARISKIMFSSQRPLSFFFPSSSSSFSLLFFFLLSLPCSFASQFFQPFRPTGPDRSPEAYAETSDLKPCVWWRCCCNSNHNSKGDSKGNSNSDNNG